MEVVLGGVHEGGNDEGGADADDTEIDFLNTVDPVPASQVTDVLSASQTPELPNRRKAGSKSVLTNTQKYKNAKQRRI